MKTDTTAPTVKKHKKHGGLRCHRCDGLMLPERLYDQALGLGPMDCWGWRCVICGELVDPLILQHRGAKEKSRRGLDVHQYAR